MQFILEEQDVFTVGSIKLIIPFQRVYDSNTNKEIHLTPIEFKLFFVLMKNHGSLVTRETFMKFVWGDTPSITKRVLDSHISDLRLKMKRTGHSIVNIRNVGYQLNLKEKKE